MSINNQAIEKLTKEMMEANNPFVQALEEYLTELCRHAAVAEKITKSNKTLKELEKEVMAVAKSRAVGSVGQVSDVEAFTMARAFFDIDEEDYKEQQEVSNIDVLDFI
ncbi:MAG: hypothetical protein JJE03_06090 [Peptostreptococcaceae bacterium]|nr:hypothetical protein [Peptostreptococcaceae bacterium]